MVEIRGKYNVAKVFTDNIEETAVGQVITLCNQPFAKGQKIRIMPDVHAGAGCVIGTTMTITDKIVPNLVGVDIGCGMHVVKLHEKRVELPKLDSVIRKYIPSGFDIRETEHKFIRQTSINNLECREHGVNLERATLSLGTLGGGNHFIELDEDKDGNKYLVIHTGSRNLGKQVAEYYQDQAYKELTKENRSAASKEIIDGLKEQGRQSEIQKELQKLKARMPHVIYELAYCDRELVNRYIHDMGIVQEFADLNRKAIAETILKEMKLHEESSFTTIHNYIDTENMILRKGAVSAQQDEILLIPMNMRDGCLLCRGKGNEDWNYSAPHGAGRLMSRSVAKDSFTVSEFKNQMKGIYTTSVGSGTLDECPMAYKPMQDILNNIGDTVEVINIIKPVYNFKAS